jgi:hypothetical protein
VLSEVATRDGRRALWQLVSVLLSLVTVALALLVLVMEVFAPQIVQFVGGGFSPATLRLAADLLRLTAPALIFLSWFSVLSGTLYALRSFTWPAFAGAGFNAVIVLITVLLVPPVQVTAVPTTTGVLESGAPGQCHHRRGGWLAAGDTGAACTANARSARRGSAADAQLEAPGHPPDRAIVYPGDVFAGAGYAGDPHLQL